MSIFFVLCFLAVCLVPLWAHGRSESFPYLWVHLCRTSLLQGCEQKCQKRFFLRPLSPFRFTYSQERGVGDKSWGFGNRQQGTEVCAHYLQSTLTLRATHLLLKASSSLMYNGNSSPWVLCSVISKLHRIGDGIGGKAFAWHPHPQESPQNQKHKESGLIPDHYQALLTAFQPTSSWSYC